MYVLVAVVWVKSGGKHWKLSEGLKFPEFFFNKFFDGLKKISDTV
jgi:hypothetical protein